MRGKVNGRFSPGREPEVEEDDSSRWLGTYGDAVTLLMAFFVMLYAMSEVDAQKFDAFLSGLEGPFGNTSVELLQGGGGIVGPGGANAETADEVTLERGDPIGPIVPQEAPTEVAEAGREGDRAAAAQLDAVEDALAAALQEVGFAAAADFRTTSRGLVVSVAADDVLFDLGETEVNDVGDSIIGAIAGVLEQFPNDVLVEGHTDDLAVATPGYSNWNLSTDRAVAVLDVLVERHDVDPRRLGAAGFGEHRPVAPNDAPANRARNRRVDVLIIREGSEDG